MHLSPISWLGRWAKQRRWMLAGLLASSLACAALTTKQPAPSGGPGRVAAPTFVLQTGHSSTGLMVAFSPDSRIVASGDRAGIIKLWDASTGRLRATLDGHIRWIHGLAFSPDGTLLASAGHEGTVQLWNPANGELRGVLRGHSREIWSLAFSPDGQLLASGSSDSTVILWDVARRSARATLKGHREWVKGVCFLPDGKTLVSGGFDGTMIFWDVSSKEARTRIPAGDLMSLAVSPDGKWLASADRGGSVKLWDAVTARLRQTFEGGLSATTLAFSRDGGTLAGSAGSVHLWSTATGRQVRDVGELRAGPDWHDDSDGLAFSPDGRLIAVGSGRAVVLRRTPTFAHVMTLQGHTIETAHALVSPDARTVASVLLYANAIDLWDVTSGRLRITLKGQEGVRSINRLAFSPDSKTIASAEDVTGNVMLWDATTGQLRRTFKAHDWDLTDLAFSADGQRLVTGCARDKVSKLWDATTASPPTVFSAAGKIAISPDGKVVAVAEGYGELRLSDSTGQRQELLQSHEGVEHLTFSPDGKLLAVADWSSIQLWNVERRERGPSMRPSSLVLGLSFSPDGKTLVTSDYGDALTTWDVSTGRQQSTVNVHGTDGLSFSPDGRFLALADYGGVVLRRVSDGASVTLVSFPGATGTRTLVHSANGLFTGDDETFDRVVFRVGGDLRTADLLSADQLFEYFHRPQLMQDFLAGRPLDLLPEVREGVGLPPAVVIVDAPSGTTSAQAARVHVRALDRGGGVGDVRVFVNGARAAVERSVGASPAEREFEVLLSPGQNVIRAEGYSDVGRVRGVSVERRVTLLSAETTQPDLHVFALTIDRYADGTRLDYPDRDGRAVLEAFQRQKGRLFRDVRPEVLADEQATREAAEAALDRIATKARPEDVFVFYAAGHGGIARCEGEKEASYRLLTHRAGLGSDRSVCMEALALGRLTKKLRAIKAKKKLLVLDTCASGAASTGETLLSIRGAEEIDAIKRLARSEGIAIVAAASERAFEVQALGHGLFTYTLLRGLGGGASSSAERVVSVFGLLGYVDRELPLLAQRYLNRPQTPIYSTQGQDFPLFALRAGDPPLVHSSAGPTAGAATAPGSAPLPEVLEARIRAHIERRRARAFACSARNVLAVRAHVDESGEVTFTLEGKDYTVEESRCVRAALSGMTVDGGLSGTLVHALERVLPDG